MQISYETLQPNWHVTYIVGGNPAEQKYAFFKSLHIAAYDLLSILFVTMLIVEKTKYSASQNTNLIINTLYKIEFICTMLKTWYAEYDKHFK